jgi:NAD+ synthetase
MFFSAGVQRAALDAVQQLIPDTKGLFTCFGLPLFYEGAVYNAVAVACDGRLLGFVAKQHLAGDGIHYEPRWFRRWPADVVGGIEVGGREYPIGDLLFECGGVRIGFEICRDAWVADRTGARLAQRGADVLLNPSASHFAFAKQEIRERFVLEGSRAFCVSYAYCNLLGNEAGRSIYDGGTLIAMGGKMLARGPRFSFADWLLTTAVVDVDSTRRAKAESYLDTNPRPAAASESGLVETAFEFPVVNEPTGRATNVSGCCTHDRAPSPGALPEGEVSRSGFKTLPLPPGEGWGEGELANNKAPSPRHGESPAATCPLPKGEGCETASRTVPGHPAWETGPYKKEEEFARSVSLALFDYLRKSHAQGFVVSLSGGADSTTVAVLVYLFARLGGLELGFEKLAEKLSHIKSLGTAPKKNDASEDIVHHLLTCVYQSTRNSGAQTFEAAKAAAEAAGAQFLKWSVDANVDEYVRTVAEATGRELTWDEHDLALQNIQARARGPGVWLLANLRGALLLTTSNRSEAAVGYATMDGDTCGGLAPIAGIDKAFLLDWLKWMEKTGPAGVGPLPALSVVNNLKPTAELRPPAADQTDEADLMPYRLLDAIERAAIRDKLLPVDVFQVVRAQFPQYETAQIGMWVERFFRLWCRNQWKRERYAPSFHLDDENLDPKTWCRFPILSSGFEKELAELREFLKGQ